MCGIVGAVAERNIVPILVEGLRRLEYRGYDSAGVAVVGDDGALGLSRTVVSFPPVAIHLPSGDTATMGPPMEPDPICSGASDPSAETWYHSHVGVGAYFSELDQEYATQELFPFPGADHFVIAVVDGEVKKVVEISVFRWNAAEGRFEGRPVQAVAP